MIITKIEILQYFLLKFLKNQSKSTKLYNDAKKIFYRLNKANDVELKKT